MRFTRTFKTALSSAAVGFLALGLTSTSAFASNNANTTFNVTATVVTACTVSATAMSFGTVVPSTTLATYPTQSSISVNCSTGDVYTIALTAGGGTGAIETSRFMMNGANKLAYALFNDSLRTVNWGTAAGTVSGTGTGAAVPYTVYGQISAQTVPVNGAYSDTITVNVTY
jgi:spore coat protein U-like protein